MYGFRPTFTIPALHDSRPSHPIDKGSEPLDPKPLTVPSELPTESADQADGVRGWGRWAWGFVALGVGLRVFAYLLHFPLWWDEAFVAVNLLQRDYRGLVDPLDFGQVCPLLFLWAELLAVRLLGFHEWSLRLFPLICSVGSLVLFRVVAGRILDGRSMLLAVGILAVSVHPIRHAADLKPYSADLLVALILTAIAFEWIRRPDQSRWFWLLAAFCPIAFLLSHPSLFIVGGILLALAWPAWQTRLASVRVAWLAVGLASTLAYAAIYVGFTRNQASAAAPGMSEMWVRSFPPVNDLLGLGRWLVVAHSGDMLAYPCGGERGGSVLSLLAGLVGLAVLGRSRQWARIGVLIGPLGLAIVAAALRLYPYGGPAPHGSAARIMQYAAPALCLLIGLGAARILERIRSQTLRKRLLQLGCVGLVIVGIAPQIAGYRHPYRAYQAEASRRFARSFWSELGRNAEVASLRWDYKAADWNSIHLGIAVALCNEAIYSPDPPHRRPELALVRSDHPLRCVLEVAPDQDSSRVVAWLEAMQQTYELRRRETLRVPINEPGRRAEFENYQVFEFVPRSLPSQPTEPAGSIGQRVVERR